MASWVALVAVLVVGCGSSSEPAKEAEVSSPPPTASSSPSAPVDRAVADLAEHLGVDGASIEVVAEEAVTWNDGSLGCAQPGFSYTQALVEGSRITLRADGARHEQQKKKKQQGEPDAE